MQFVVLWELHHEFRIESPSSLACKAKSEIYSNGEICHNKKRTEWKVSQKTAVVRTVRLSLHTQNMGRENVIQIVFATRTTTRPSTVACWVMIWISINHSISVARELLACARCENISRVREQIDDGIFNFQLSPNELLLCSDFLSFLFSLLLLFAAKDGIALLFMLQQHPWLQIHKQWRSKKSFPSLKREKKNQF